MPARYTVNVLRPDLCERARVELGLKDVRARLLEGSWMVSGRNGRGRLRLFHLGKRGWEEITTTDEDEVWAEFEELVDKLEQVRLL